MRSAWQALAAGLLVLLAACAAAPSKPAASPAPAEDDAPLRELKQARDLVQAHQPEAAIAHLDQAIAQYESRYAAETRHLYCARSRDEFILYTANAAAIRDPAGVLVLPPYWAEAYFLKGYALGALGRYEDAQVWLARAYALSPANAQYLSELGYNYQLRKDWAQSLALYRKAEAASDFSPEPQKQHDLTRALRGQAYALAQQGHYDESEQLYRRCLALDADDANAQRELQNIRRQGALN